MTRIKDSEFPDRELRFYGLLARSLEMKEVWDWYAKATAGLPNRYQSSVSFCIVIRRSKGMPGKPGSIPPKQRDQYFKKVRKQVEGLIDLLANTKFDHGLDGGKYIEGHQEVEKSFANDIDIAKGGATAEGYDWFTAYNIDREGANKLPWDYPDCHLVDILNGVIEWTQLSDYWGRGWISSKPIRQIAHGAPVIQFNCILYERYLRSTGIKIPFEILAAIANVALELPYEEIVSEDTARKQVTRYLNRIGRPPAPSDIAFEEPPF